MISEHEFVTAVRDRICPSVREVEDACLALYNRAFSPGVGPTGLTGSGEIDETIQRLTVSATLLQKIAKHHGIKSCVIQKGGE